MKAVKVLSVILVLLFALLGCEAKKTNEAKNASFCPSFGQKGAFFVIKRKKVHFQKQHNTKSSIFANGKINQNSINKIK